MNDRVALLAAVRAAPADDLPRLVYADWLDDHGGEAGAARAALIRVQVELWKRDPGRQTGCGLVDAKDPNFGNPLVEQERVLAKQCAARVFDGLDPRMLLESRGDHFPRLETWVASPHWFERGFVTHVAGAGLRLTRELLPWLRRTETVRTVAVRDRRPYAMRFARGFQWWREGHAGESTPAHLPAELFTSMRLTGSGRPWGDFALRYPSYGAATTALSEVLLADVWTSCSEALLSSMS